MATQATPAAVVTGPWSSRASGPGRYTSDELAALHSHLALKFRSMANQHRPGCAFIAPYPSTHDLSPTEILVIPAHSEAAMFSVAFLQCDRTIMRVRIGEHGVWECSEDVLESSDDAPGRSLAATAEMLFSVALSGRYREEVWSQATTGRYEGGQSYYLDDSDEWQELGCPCQPNVSLRLLRTKMTVQDHWYEPY